jgi:hypothetical protein
VPNAFEGQLRIANMRWDAGLEDPTSELFSSLASRLEHDLGQLFGPALPSQELTVRWEVILLLISFSFSF